MYRIAWEKAIMKGSGVLLGISVIRRFTAGNSNRSAQCITARVPDIGDFIRRSRRSAKITIPTPGIKSPSQCRRLKACDMSLLDIQMMCMDRRSENDRLAPWSKISLNGHFFFYDDETISVVRYRKIAAMMCLKLSRIAAMFLQEPSMYRSDSC